MKGSSDRAAQWVQMWLDVSSEQSPASADRSSCEQCKRPAVDEDFENNGLVIMQRIFMRYYAKLSPEEREKLRARAPVYAREQDRAD
jgi:hypothetical protein